ncbi:diguanylate cyclase, partial [Patulibacter sp. S7RM1-6]
RIVADRQLAAAVRAGDLDAVRRRAQRLVAPATDARRIRLTLTQGSMVVDVGNRDAMLPGRNQLVGSDGRALATLETSVLGPRSFAKRIEELTGRTVQIRDAATNRVIAGDAGPGETMADGRIRRVDDGRWTVVSMRQTGFDSEAQDVVLFAPASESRASVGERLALAGTLLLFLLLAGGGATVISRSLQRQVAILLEGSRRLGRGEFGHEIPGADGDDEFGQLAAGFNDMSRQLRGRMEELRAERTRLQAAIRRIGETFAANLDRQGLLNLVAHAVADGVRGDAARTRILVGDHAEAAATGEDEVFDLVLRRAEDAAAEGRDGRASDGALHALAVRMNARGLRGTVVVGRRDEPFSAEESEVVRYLAAQAAVSLENVGRHEQAEREAHTDALTGIANRRRFDDLLARTLDLAHEHGVPVSLLMVDLDHFKRVNDEHGHASGDLVLQAAADALRVNTRAGDVAARFGGEEFAVLLPGAAPDVALGIAEELRDAIARTQVTTADGRELRVTASIGAATLHGEGLDAAGLVAAADGALYRAKRTGRNRTVTADVAPARG